MYSNLCLSFRETVPLNHNSVEVQMFHILFILIHLVLTALKLFNIGKFGLFTLNLLFAY